MMMDLKNPSILKTLSSASQEVELSGRGDSEEGWEKLKPQHEDRQQQEVRTELEASMSP